MAKWVYIELMPDLLNQIVDLLTGLSAYLILAESTLHQILITNDRDWHIFIIITC